MISSYEVSSAHLNTVLVTGLRLQAFPVAACRLTALACIGGQSSELPALEILLVFVVMSSRFQEVRDLSYEVRFLIHLAAPLIEAAAILIMSEKEILGRASFGVNQR